MPVYKPVEVSYAQSAEFGIASIPVPASISEGLIPVSLRRTPADGRRDVVEGTLRHRHFLNWVVTYSLTDLEDRVSVLVLEIRHPDAVSFGADLLDRLDRVGRALLPGYAALREAGTRKGGRP